MNAFTDIRSRGAFQDVITQACLEGDDCRRALPHDPRAVIERHQGHVLPESVEIGSVTDTARTASVASIQGRFSIV